MEKQADELPSTSAACRKAASAVDEPTDYDKKPPKRVRRALQQTLRKKLEGYRTDRVPLKKVLPTKHPNMRKKVPGKRSIVQNSGARRNYSKKEELRQKLLAPCEKTAPGLSRIPPVRKPLIVAVKKTGKDDAAPEVCNTCGKSDRRETIVLCDYCHKAHHYACLSPPLEKSQSDYKCSACSHKELLASFRKLILQCGGKAKEESKED